MKKVLLISFMLLSALVLDTYAQEVSVSGRIADEDGQALPGVNVILKGTSTGTTSDIEGNYRLTLPGSDGVLVFSFIGFATQELEVANQTTINVTLLPDTRQLSEVVITGYGTTLKKEFTGASASISSEDIGKVPATSATQILQGQASGVFVTSQSGTPGGGISVNIRGIKSISSSTQPLYVVDGVPVVSGSLQQNGFGGQGQNALAGLNPQDIENIEVLKDASTRAIYGTRGANGVVLITTKRGKSGKTSINVSAWTGVAEATNTIETVNSQQWVDIKNEARVNDGQTALTNEEWGWDGVTSTNWIDEVFRQASVSEYQINASGGDEKTKFYVSGSFRDEEGVIIGSEYQRATARLNLDHNASEKFRFGTSLSISSDLNKRIQNDNNIYGVYSVATLGTPLTPIFDEDGEYVDNVFNTNPVRSALAPRYDNKTLKMIGNLFFNYNIIDGLDFRTDFGYDYTQLVEDQYEPASTAIGRSANGRGTFSTSSRGRYNIEPTLRFAKTVNDVHSFNAVVGGTILHENDIRSSAVGENFAKESLTYITSASLPQTAFSYREEYSFNSLFGRLNYSFDEKYLFSGSVRRDGSSRFGPGNRYGLFWAVSAGWNFSDEAFMENVSWLELGKLRASYGTTGNDAFGEYRYQGTFSGGGNYFGQPAFVPSNIANEDLRWESTTSLDVGIELALFANRVNLNVGYFKENTTDLLYNAPLPGTTGFLSVFSNIGELLNEGYEIELSTVNVNTPSGFRWETSANLTIQDNEVVSLINDEPILAGFSSAIIEGEPLNTFYGLNWLGVDPATGESVFEDVDGDGIASGADTKVFGDAFANILGGFTNKFSYKGISLDVFFQFVADIDIYNNTRSFTENPASNFGKSPALLDRWQNPGDITSIPRLSGNFGLNGSDGSRWVEKGDYLRLKTITLAYDLPQSIVSKINLRNVRIYATGQNLLTFTQYSGSDPEVSIFGTTNTSQGTDFLTFPQAKMISGGINIGF